MKINKISYVTNNMLHKINKTMFSNIQKTTSTKLIPVVTTPILAYVWTSYEETNELHKNLANEVGKNYHPITDQLNRSKEEFTSRGLIFRENAVDRNGELTYKWKSYFLNYDTSKAQIESVGKTFDNSMVDLNGKLNYNGNYVYKQATTFTGSPNNNVTNEPISETDCNSGISDNNFSSGYQSQLDEMESLVPEVDPELQTELDAIDTDISCLDDMLDNPILEGAIAEMLPGTKFFKPGKDLLDGDYEKAAVGTASRAGEILLAPVKLSWAAFGAIAGGASWLAGNRGEGTGFVGGYKHASHMWAKSRNKLENYIIDREEADPNAKQVQMRKVYEASTKNEVNKIYTKNKEDVNNIKSKYADADKQAEAERQKTEQKYEKRIKTTSKIIEKANSNISKNIANQEYSRQHLNQIISERKRNLRYQTQMIAKLEKEIQSAQNDCNTKLKQELEKQKSELEKAWKMQSQALLSGINEILEFSKQYEAIYAKHYEEGFKSIAGYEDTKRQLAKIFGVPLVQNKKNSDIPIPNVIALYGPKGTGKSLFASSLAKQFDCIYGGDLLLKAGDDINFKRLMKIVDKAKSDYRTTGKHTIIQIDEIEYFGTNQKPSFWKRIKGKPQNLEELMSECAGKYGCTLVVTTNNPEKIDNSIKSKMKSLFVPPANLEEMAKILEYHVNNRNKESINYNKLVNMLSSKMHNGDSYSNARLENIVQTVMSKNGTITQKYLEDEIAAREPDISKEEIDFYKRGF